MMVWFVLDAINREYEIVLHFVRCDMVTVSPNQIIIISNKGRQSLVSDTSVFWMIFVICEKISWSCVICISERR